MNKEQFNPIIEIESARNQNRQQITILQGRHRELMAEISAISGELGERWAVDMQLGMEINLLNKNGNIQP